MTQQKYAVLGIGSPMLDHLIEVSQPVLHSLSERIGGMKLITHEQLLFILKELNFIPKTMAGGSAMNVMQGLAHLGQKCAILGKIGNDEAGKQILKEIDHTNIFSLLIKTSTPTGQVLCFFAPNYERTFYSFVGAGGELSSKELLPSLFQNTQLLHIEGYALLFGDLVIKALILAREAGAIVSFDLANFKIVERYKQHILEEVLPNVDILFANSAEAYALLQLPPEQSCVQLGQFCETAVVTMSAQGCFATRKKEKIFQPAFPVKTLDTTGAGDLFASGFLHAYLANSSLEKCAWLGAKVASEVVQVIGTHIPEEKWKELKTHLTHQEGHFD